MKLRVARIFRPIALCLTFSLSNVSGAACGKLTDAEVKAVDSTSVTFATGASGEVRIPFQP